MRSQRQGTGPAADSPVHESPGSHGSERNPVSDVHHVLTFTTINTVTGPWDLPTA